MPLTTGANQQPMNIIAMLIYMFGEISGEYEPEGDSGKLPGAGASGVMSNVCLDAHTYASLVAPRKYKTVDPFMRSIHLAVTQTTV
jgi:hypothetical protein